LEYIDIEDLYNINFTNYSHVHEDNLITTLFEKIYLNDKKDRTFGNDQGFLNHCIAKLCKDKKSYDTVVNELVDLIKKIEIDYEDNFDKKDTLLFQINLFIDNAEDLFQTLHCSSPMYQNSGCDISPIHWGQLTTFDRKLSVSPPICQVW
jgi:hypothetical protein